jgi:ATP-dependent protease ClpP protease subunit
VKKKQKFWQITTSERVADINIYGDITSFEWFASDVSSYTIKQEIDALDVDTINIYINSYGGEVAEALAIYSALKRYSANIHTYCDGFACSAATIIFAAGDVRTMGPLALLMIHNCMSYLGYANSEEMRKAAEDNDKINQSSIEAYKKISNLSEEEIKEMMDAETWLTAQECLKYGFATEIADEDEDENEIQQSAFSIIREAVITRNQSKSTLEEKVEALYQKLCIEPPKTPKEPEPKNSIDFLATLFNNLI